MLRLLTCLICFVICSSSYSQSVTVRLADAVRNLEADTMMKHALVSIFVVDGKTGKPVFNRNNQIGLAPASCQKVITSTTAFELLGSDYHYKTMLGYDGKMEAGVLNGNLHITGSGDPTLASRRWETTREKQVLQKWVSEIKKAGIKSITGTILNDEINWGSSVIPDGWIWQDIGNYYGAGASGFNWLENQYDLALRSGTAIGDTCEIISITPSSVKPHLIPEVKTAEKGSGDNAYIYLPTGAHFGYVRGTIPLGEKSFVISGSLQDPFYTMVCSFNESLNTAGVSISKQGSEVIIPPESKVINLYTHFSPGLDSINYWFLKKSINLYGEAFIKTIALEKEGFATTEKGVTIIKNFWSLRGIEKSALNIMDGSGLSPQNRVTTDALVKVMQYAKSRPWFHFFYQALPEINGISMKSGSINGVRSYTGYIKSKGGIDYTFAIIVNNYDGSSSEMVKKMWRILDVMK